MAEPGLTELIERARRGNPVAAGALYEQHQPEIYRYLFFRLRDAFTAEDLTGEVFLKMLQSISTFQGDGSGFRGWLFQIARNLSIDYLRRSRAHPNRTISEDARANDTPPERAVEGSYTVAQLKNAIACLNDDQKDVILMRFVCGLPLAETARTLHKSEDAVKGLQRRGLLALRDALKERECTK